MATHSLRETPLTDPASVLIVLLAVSGCRLGDVTTYSLDPPDAVSATIAVMAEDLDAAQALGWSDGMIPGADVSLTSVDLETPWTWEGVTDDAGRITIPDVPAAEYAISITRLLTEEERQMASAGSVVAFLGTWTRTFRNQNASHDLQVPSSRGGGLLISELYSHALRAANGNCCYYFGGYLEIYNNADTVIHLDGKVIGAGFAQLTDAPGRDCNRLEPLRADPGGIWADRFEMFPGDGDDYPLAPGMVAVFATDAIDHRSFAMRARDLSGADFESRGTADVDNPEVPNLINIGLRDMILNHGFFFRTHGVAFIADSFDRATLPRMTDPDFPNEYVRIPAARILDIVVVSDRIGDNPVCDMVTHPSLNRGYMRALNLDDGDISLHRKPLFTRPDGRTLLQSTRVSSSDFMTAAATPGIAAEQ